MAKRFFTSDLHFNSTVLVEERLRPFANVEKMNRSLVRNINQRCTEDDILIHLGDFLQYGNDREWEGMKTKPSEFIRLLNPTFVNVQGNHDAHNGIKSVCHSMRTFLGKKYSVSMSHYPSNNPKARGTFRKGDVHLCGHVHNEWKYFIDFENKVLNVNVGVDVWGYNPVSEDELIGFIDRIILTNGFAVKK
jgi:Predicted phosphoesterase or phosphohydrolase